MLGYQFNAATPYWIILPKDLESFINHETLEYGSSADKEVPPEVAGMSALASCSLCVIFLIIDVNRCYINAISSFSASKDIFRKVVILRSHEITRYDTVSLPFYNYVRDGVDRFVGNKA